MIENTFRLDEIRSEMRASGSVQPSEIRKSGQKSGLTVRQRGIAVSSTELPSAAPNNGQQHGMDGLRRGTTASSAE
jgi:hypothetical protein